MRASLVRTALVATLAALACAPRDSTGDTSAADTIAASAAGTPIDTPIVPPLTTPAVGSPRVATPPLVPPASATPRPRATPAPAESAVRYKSPPESLKAAPDYPRVPKRPGGYIWIDSTKKDTTRRP